MTLWIDRLINLCKWPIALMMAVNIPMLLQECWGLLTICWATRPSFFVGLVAYIVVWKIFLSRRILGGWVPTLVHESIHAFFAILTFHRVVDFKVRWKGGGHITYSGGVGNWLISVSPYFVPLTTLLVWSLEHFWPIDPNMRSLVIGVLFGFETVYVWRQIHRQQTDLQEVGWFFSILFLPGALLLCYAITISLVLLGSTEAFQVVGKLVENTQQVMLQCWIWGMQQLHTL